MSEKGMITFDIIRKIQREEQRSQKLSKLPENFYENVNSYLNSKKNLEVRRTVLEFKNIERLVEDIFNRRERKILNMAIISARTSIPPENLTDDEMKFFNSILDTVKKRRKSVLISESDRELAEKTGLVVFNQDAPQFVGSDMQSYGPFRKGDIAKLPEDNKKVLIEQGMVEEFKIEK